MNNKFFLFLLIMPFSLLVRAQEAPLLTLTETKHNFGTVNETDGAVNYNFVFRNTGKAALKISEVNAACGCTTPEWSSDSIMPGQVGFIKVQYDPFNRPGPFNKSLTVTSNANPSVLVLFIEGYVVPKATSPKTDFPVVKGQLRFKNENIHLGNIPNNEVVEKLIEVYNDGEKSIKFKNKDLSPPHIKFSYEPQNLEPGQSGVIKLHYDGKAKKDLGYANDNVVIYTDEKEEEAKSFNVIAVIEEYFPELTLAELAEAPKIHFEKVIHDFGTMNKGEVVKTQFIFANNGGKELNLRKLSSNCTCIRVTAETDVILPGKSSYIEVTFDSSKRGGFEQKQVSIFTDDPTGKTKNLTIKATVRE